MLRMPSALPGWTRAHVVGHLARNAEALTRLANWADTGVETPMYTSREQRAVEIEEAANLSGTVLRSEVATTARALDEAIAMLDNRGWSATVRSALGRVVPAHGNSMGYASRGMAARRRLARRPDGRGSAGRCHRSAPRSHDPAFVPEGQLSSRPADTLRSGPNWQLRGPRGQPASVTAPAAELAGWLTGRIPGGTIAAHLPQLPKWL